MTTDLLPARIITNGKHSGFANEVGPHNPELLKRWLANPVCMWVSEFLEGDRRHPHPEAHLDITEAVMSDKRSVFKAPRSFAKTTTAVTNFVTFLGANYRRIVAGKYPGIYPHSNVRIIEGTAGKSQEVLAKIKDIWDNNETIVAEYGVLQGKTWHEKKLITKDGFEVTAAGRGAGIRGFRPTLLICDDLDDDEEVLSDERMEKAFHWFDTAVYNTLDELEYQCFVIGTTVDEVSLLNYIAEKPSFKVRSYQAYVGGVQEPGRELWPSKWPHEKLQIQKADIGHRAFMSEFMNEPQPSESPIFERSWFQKYDPKSAMFERLLEKTMYTIECCDPAISKKDGSDYTALVTISVTFDQVPKIYIRTKGVKRGHWSPTRTVSETFKLYDEFFANEVGVEKVAYQAALIDLVNVFMDQHGRNLEVTPLVPDGDKERRANSVVSLVERGQVFYDPDDPMHLRLIDECVLFKPGKLNIKKDLMDAFVYCLILVKKWSRNRECESGATKVLPGNRRAHSVTGI